MSSDVNFPQSNAPHLPGPSNNPSSEYTKSLRSILSFLIPLLSPAPTAPGSITSHFTKSRKFQITPPPARKSSTASRKRLVMRHAQSRSCLMAVISLVYNASLSSLEICLVFTPTDHLATRKPVLVPRCSTRVIYALSALGITITTVIESALGGCVPTTNVYTAKIDQPALIPPKPPLNLN